MKILCSGNPMNETITFDINLSVVGNPIIDIFVDDRKLDSTKFTIPLDFGKHNLRIIHSGKTNQTPENFVKINSVTIDGVNIRDILYTDSFNIPEYPEPWATQQQEQGIELEERVLGQTELTFNCEWCLPFTSPFFEFVMKHV